MKAKLPLCANCLSLQAKKEEMRDYKKSIKVGAGIEDVYAALTTPFAIELWSGYPAQMSAEAGSEFELWGGDICGRNLAFEENKMVRQEWYLSEDAESILTIKLTARSNVRTEIYVVLTNIGDDAYGEVATWMDETYVASLQQFLEEGDED